MRKQCKAYAERQPAQPFPRCKTTRHIGKTLPVKQHPRLVAPIYTKDC